MFQHQGGNIYQLSGLMQSQEYVMCAEAAKQHRDLLQEINSEKGEISTLPDLSLGKGSHIIDTNLSRSLEGLWDFGGLWMDQDPQFIVNRYATKKHFELLERLNRESLVGLNN